MIKELWFLNFKHDLFLFKEGGKIEVIYGVESQQTRFSLKAHEEAVVSIKVKKVVYVRPPWPNDQTLFVKHLKVCFSNIVWTFGHVTKHCLQAEFSLKIWKHFLVDENRECLTSNVLRRGQTEVWRTMFKRLATSQNIALQAKFSENFFWNLKTFFAWRK